MSRDLEDTVKSCGALCGSPAEERRLPPIDSFYSKGKNRNIESIRSKNRNIESIRGA